jgi:hypothetical protein
LASVDDRWKGAAIAAIPSLLVFDEVVGSFPLWPISTGV